MAKDEGRQKMKEGKSWKAKDRRKAKTGGRTRKMRGKVGRGEPKIAPWENENVPSPMPRLCEP